VNLFPTSTDELLINSVLFPCRLGIWLFVSPTYLLHYFLWLLFIATLSLLYLMLPFNLSYYMSTLQCDLWHVFKRSVKHSYLFDNLDRWKIERNRWAYSYGWWYFILCLESQDTFNYDLVGYIYHCENKNPSTIWKCDYEISGRGVGKAEDDSLPLSVHSRHMARDVRYESTDPIQSYATFCLTVMVSLWYK